MRLLTFASLFRVTSLCMFMTFAWTFSKSIEVISLFVLPVVLLVVRHDYMTTSLLWLTLSVMITISYVYYGNGALQGGIGNLIVFFCAGGSIASLSIAPAVAEKELLTRNRTTRWGTLLPVRRTFFLFPALWTITWTLWRAWMPLGSWGDWASTLKGTVDPLVQVAAIFGLAGVDFMLGWWAHVAAELIAETPDLVREEHEARDADDEGAYLLGAHRVREVRQARSTHVRWSVFLLAVVLVCGSIRLSEVEPNSEHMPTLGLGCALAPSSKVDNRAEEMLRITRRLGTQSKIVVWSEAAVDLQSLGEYEVLRAKVLDIAFRTRAHIAFTYNLLNDRGKFMNMVELVGVKNNTIFRYQKTHLVFLAESFATEAGPGDIPLKEINITVARKHAIQHSLNVSAAICHDMDYPQLLQQAADAKLVLSPASTWSSSIGLKHMQMTSIRAVEEGIWILRCDAGGVSGIIDDLGRIRFWQVSYKEEFNGLLIQAPLFLPKRQTVYSMMSGLPWLGGDWPIVLILVAVAFFAAGPDSLVQSAFNAGGWIREQTEQFERRDDPRIYRDDDF